MEKLLKWINKPAVLWAVAGTQLAVVLGMVLLSALPLWVGQPMQLPVYTRDPRDLMRGQYVVLSYDFNRLEIGPQVQHDLDSAHTLHFGDKVYVQMRQRAGLFFPVGVFRHKPDTGKFILAYVNEERFEYQPRSDYNMLSLKAGIESYFASPVEAKALEEAVQNSPRREWDEAEAETIDSTGRVVIDTARTTRQQQAEAQRLARDSNLVVVTLMVTRGGTARIHGIRYRPAPKPKQ